METSGIERPDTIWAGVRQGLREDPLVFFAPLVAAWRLAVAWVRFVERTQDDLLRVDESVG